MRFHKIQFYIVMIVLNLFLFQDALQMRIRLFQYYDEIISFGSITILLLYILFTKRINKISIAIIICLTVIIILGFMGWKNNRYQIFFFALQDCLLICKSPALYVVTRNVLSRFDISRYAYLISGNMKVIILIFFILTISNLVTGLFPTYDVRLGIPSQQLFFSHPFYLSNTCIVVMCLLAVFSVKNTHLYIIMAAVVVFFTLRVKVLVSLALFCFLYITYKRNIKLSFGKLALFGSFALLISYQQIGFYFFSENTEEFGDTARAALTEYGPIIANDHFPLGSGFGSFACYPSAMNYSEIYYKYELNEVWGMSPDYPDFLSDSFWPMIIGELGYIGTLFYSVIVISLSFDVWSIRKKEKMYFMGTLVLFCHIMIATASDSSLANAYSLSYIFNIAILINTSMIRDKKKQLLLPEPAISKQENDLVRNPVVN